MDIDPGKTLKDAAYITVGVGVTKIISVSAPEARRASSWGATDASVRL